MTRSLLLLLVPIGPALYYLLEASPIWVFSAGIVGIAVLADWIRYSTEQLALHVGSAVGSLLTVSLGSVAELLLALFVLARGEADVVHAQITGSIIGTSLLGLGLAIVVGGLQRGTQRFRRERAGLLSSLLVLVVLALLLPAVFHRTVGDTLRQGDVGWRVEELSLTVSVVLLLLYGANLLYTLVTHRDVFASGEEEEGEPRWSVWTCLVVLAACTAAAALESELVSDDLAVAAETLGMTPLFLGVIVLALVGTIADLFAAVWFAHRDRMGAAMTVCIGSSIQIALVVAPLLVILSWLIGSPMTLVFNNPIELFAIAGTALIVNSIAGDGETTWFEGVLLIGVYVLFGLAFFFV
jgi:Ca2+:H+ antiporter